MGQFQFDHNFSRTADRAFTINPPKLSAVSGQRSAVSGQWSAVSGQWSVVSGQWSAVSGQRSAVSGQRSAVSRWPWPLADY
ncbi:hypothetical protein LYNGBM3L_44410 [Moorena producens 3L]|uniref:Uncharacterized protein n=1 Tax=Moorena producens 3L TaxID=489825 RepID=F4XWQ2_9CYAN|nr:hypothetical protein [Moorena producens]EGJ31012.1 hypothetical protein LYNGBM3L_44410 [Moorena producens 3L]